MVPAIPDGAVKLATRAGAGVPLVRPAATVTVIADAGNTVPATSGMVNSSVRVSSPSVTVRVMLRLRGACPVRSAAVCSSRPRTVNSAASGPPTEGATWLLSVVAAMVPTSVPGGAAVDNVRCCSTMGPMGGAV